MERERERRREKLADRERTQPGHHDDGPKTLRLELPDLSEGTRQPEIDVVMWKWEMCR